MVCLLGSNSDEEQKGSSRVADPALMEKVDEDWVQASSLAEARCVHKADVPFTASIAKLRRESKIFRKIESHNRNKMSMKQAAEENGATINFILPENRDARRKQISQLQRQTDAETKEA